MHCHCYLLISIQKAWSGRTNIDGGFQGRHNIFAIFINKVHTHLFWASLCDTELNANDSEENWVSSGNLC